MRCSWFHILLFSPRFKKCKEEGMTYNNCDDSRVQIPREMFEARQRQLSEVTCIKRQTRDSLRAKTRRQLGTKIRNRNKKVEVQEVENTSRDSCIVPNPSSESKYAVSEEIPCSPKLRFSKESMIGYIIYRWCSFQHLMFLYRRRQI